MQSRTRAVVSLLAFAVIALSNSIGASRLRAGEEDLDEVLAKSSAAWNNADTWQADFTQTRSVNGKRTVKTGHVFFVQPGKIAFRYQQPEEIQVAVTENHVIAYYPSRKRVHQFTVPFVGNLATVLQLTEDPLAIHLLYDVQWAEPKNPAAYSVEFTPRLGLPLEPDLAKLRVDYNKQTFLPDGFWLFNKQGGWIRYEYQRAQVNTKIAEAVFKIDSPRSATIINATDLRQVLMGLFTDEK